MELKRILARDTRSAMEQAIQTYGPDVLVISNHQVGAQTELVVAIEVPEEPTTLSAADAAHTPAASSAAAASVVRVSLIDGMKTSRFGKRTIVQNPS